MQLDFDETRQKALKFYKRVVKELKAFDDPGYADRLVTVVLHVVRQSLTLEESVAFIDILPMHVKGVYVHGWKLNRYPKRLSVPEFLTALRIRYPHTSGKHPGSDESLETDVRGIFRVLQQEAVLRGVPDLKQKLPDALHTFCEPPAQSAIETENEKVGSA
jgi:uncharacterized protein (DUF2267 family)